LTGNIGFYFLRRDYCFLPDRQGSIKLQMLLAKQTMLLAKQTMLLATRGLGGTRILLDGCHSARTTYVSCAALEN